ncbi:Lrp/AsnC family transcriptional regulator [Thermomonas sp.]|jgi:DNA-binding Lrp family transcriptional regulator|uniref:Lrp/AsnC family transcriptional regulator n=1 Tax=Thermomonas sp. TaxID=1971895 RepID=UPI001B5C177A|nr:Lrp/AsnC family transcriptional regulator [Thermomonas sp.]MBK6332393.1 Lrp/AsnC family transcriptional regulator [Thermomonas sp.]MBK6416980.1 Lrp/AsnC family transcriptional regulator [Thermomonas sp.]MBK6924213.1 Lrp/AsnC family transcriptional regulator [Thermomonas sp.]MBK7204734.1 Lrp/AsnC family transcriptional regulator [Thermomonas sp.]MBK9670274.1 Lrp/AsnC family transcriptional regulator [Thermomonas sp.]
MTHDLDRTDRRLLAALQDDARLTVAELAERVALSTSPCWRRVRRLEQAGYVTGYHAQLSAERLGYGITAFVSVVMGSHTQEVARAFEARLRDIPEVIACHNVSGRYDFLLEVVATDLAAYGEFARNVLQALPGVTELHSSFSLKSLKAERRLPLHGT